MMEERLAGIERVCTYMCSFWQSNGSVELHCRSRMYTQKLNLYDMLCALPTLPYVHSGAS